MALDDITMPEGDDYGPFTRIDHKPLNAAESFVRGEPVQINSDGELAESGDDPVAVDFAGIALDSGDTVGATDAIGTFRQSIGQSQQGASPNLPTTSDATKYHKVSIGSTVESGNFATDGAGTLATPTQANAIGLGAGFTLNGGVYSIDVGVTNNVLVITDVLDNNGDSIANRATNATGVTVVATVTACQFAQVADAT